MAELVFVKVRICPICSCKHVHQLGQYAICPDCVSQWQADGQPMRTSAGGGFEPCLLKDAIGTMRDGLINPQPVKIEHNVIQRLQPLAARHPVVKAALLMHQHGMPLLEALCECIEVMARPVCSITRLRTASRAALAIAASTFACASVRPGRGWATKAGAAEVGPDMPQGIIQARYDNLVAADLEYDDSTLYCPTCKQKDECQHGEFACPACGLPTTHDDDCMCSTCTTHRAGGAAPKQETWRDRAPLL